MLHLFQSNRLEALAELLHGVLAVPPQQVYARETVIVQARGMGRWLSLRIAERVGVCANIDFPLPASFLWRLIETVLGTQSRQGPFGVDDLAWRLHVMLQTPPVALAPYLAGGEERRRWRLAQRLAALFDSYLVYRPEWLATWEEGRLLQLGPDEGWQAELWRRLAADRNTPHRADLMQRLITRLRDPAPLPLPERIVAFGMSSLPPALLDVLEALALHCDVALFVLNPCQEAWRDVDRRSVATTPGERLLAAWGGQGRDFLDRVSAQATLHDLFMPGDAPTLLGAMQEAVLTLAPLDDTLLADGSLEVHACHSPLRQVETLKDALLARLQADDSLQANDVVVLCPDIETFAPHIEAVFGRGEPALPYAVADRGDLQASPLLAGFLALLKLPDTHWEVAEIVALFDVPALLAQFGLAENDLPLLRQWIATAGIRRGRDGDAFSWQAGLGRLLLGVTMPAEWQGAGQIYAGLHPIDDLDLRFGERVAGLARLVRTLGQWQDALAVERTLADWSALLLRWADVWFGEDRAVDPTRERLRQAMVQLRELGERSQVVTPVGRAAIAEWCEAALGNASGAGGFLTGGVTFAQLVPMRNIPFRVLAILGLEDGAFPREQRPDGFDLVARFPRAGDRSRRLDDRWLFLESLLAARDALLLFYTGRDARSDVALPPATVVADLLDAVADGTSAEVAQSLQFTHPLQPFSPRRFAADNAQPSFDARWASIADRTGQGETLPPPLAELALPAKETEIVELADLIAFASDPAGWFLRRQGVRFERADELPEAREPFVLSDRAERQLLALAGERADDADYVAAMGWAAAILPADAPGALWAAQMAQHVAPALAQWRQIPSTDWVIDIELGELRLMGHLQGVDAQALVLRQPGALWESSRVAAWLRHLALCASGAAASETRLIGLDEMATYRAAGDAAAQLARWLECYLAALRQPPRWLLRAGLAYAQAFVKAGDAAEAHALALGKAEAAWIGNEHLMGEGSMASVRALWREQPPFDEAFGELVQGLLVPLVQAETRAKLA